jgi:hypothetical protein
VTDVALGDQADRAGPGVTKREDLWVLRRLVLGLAGGPEGHQLCVAQVQFALGAGEELGVLRQRTRPAPLDEADAEVVQVLGDGELVRHRQCHALALGAVAQGRVEDVESVCQTVRLGRHDVPSFIEKTVLGQTKNPSS